MKTCTIRNHGLTYIVVLILCQLFDYATSNTLSFINLAHPMEIGQIIHFEDLISTLTFIALAACVLVYLFASQSTVYRAVLLTAALSTLGLVLNIAGLLFSLVTRQVNPPFLLIDAAIVYASTVLLFSVWYWILDHESQQARCSGKDVPPVLIFPQNATKITGYEGWKPGFIDYLFLSFHTSSTVGPTDTLVLSKRAKITMICQVTISLIVLIVLAARAIGILR
ncbi:MAG: hypothetical protein NTV68_16485 [Methanomicrobiales archaeon]|nr:hypothetical protein [Methanomicrobiales archaeon]